MQINNKGSLIRKKCADYIVQGDFKPEIVMEPSEERIQFSIEWKRKFANESLSYDEAEYDAAPYTIYHLLPKFSAVWLHAAVVEMEGRAYAFTARPGCGKSTHVSIWKKAFGDKVRIINGDNPILRFEKDTFYAYGTPFCGKEGWQVNVGVPLKGICFLERGMENRITKMDSGLAFGRLINDNHSITPDTLEDHMNLYEKLLELVPIYRLECNMELEAAVVAWEGMQQIL